jgi:phosphoglycerol transferase
VIAARRFKRYDLYTVAAIVAVIIAAWCIVHHRLNRADWEVPLSAASDSWTTLAVTKAGTEGYFPLGLLKFNPELGAPYTANWNDWPTTEEIIFVASGVAARFLGVFAAANFMVLLGHVLAGISFYVVCRQLRYRRVWAAVGSLAFALSHYAFQRGLGHLGLTYYWHIPLCLLVVWWCGSRRGLILRGARFWFALGVALLTGLQNPYYTNVFLQLLALAALVQLVRRRWRKTAAPLLVGTAAVVGFISMNLDTVYYQRTRGPNPEPSYRSYQNLEIYALKPIDLLIPPPDHRAYAARELAWRYMYDEAHKTYLRGEAFFPYLGLAGIAALVALGLVSIRRAAAFPRYALPMHGVVILWLILYSVVGGLNGVLGQMGLTAFRCTDRNSIFILALALFFGVKSLTRLTRGWKPVPIGACSTAIVGLILWDQLPAQEQASAIGGTRAALESDRSFTFAMQNALPHGAMIFQLPVMKFPESWPINEMGDYEHLRPYLYSSTLHYSYGSNKGRGEEDWQTELAGRPPREMATALEKKGFSAIYLNRKGFSDGGAALLAELKAEGYQQTIESQAHDLVCVPLRVSAQIAPADRPPEFSSGWYPEEGDRASESWRYSSGDAEIVLHNDSGEDETAQITFLLASYSPRTVRVYSGTQLVYTSPPLTSEKISQVLELKLKPGITKLSFQTEPAVRFPNNPDTRLLGFILYNFHVAKAPAREVTP